MSEYRNPTAEPGYSTLEVNHRGEFSTLQVKPAEGIEPFNAPASTSQKHPEELPQYETNKPWWRRYWLVIVVLTLLETNGKDNVAENATTSSHDSTSTTPKPSRASTTTSATSTTTSYPTVKPTATPGPTDVPGDPIWIGTSEEDGEKYHIGFALDGTKNAACNYGIIPVPEPDNPCSHPFLLPNGFQYSWEGCGGPTWMTWKNPSSDDPEYHTLHKGNCEDKPKSFDCKGVFISVRYLCGNKTDS
ncbi:hypothetical protein FSST1_006965 [Fusarium sambucinum]